MTESEWKIFRSVRVDALDRLCGRALGEITQAAAQEGKSNHDRFLAVFDLVMDCNDQIADAFDHLSRSKALMQLTIMRSMGLLTDEDLAQFSQQTREDVVAMSGGR